MDITCAICGSSIKNARYYEEHLNKHQAKDPVSDLIGQEKIRLQLNRKLHQCPHCEKSFSTPYTLKTHISNNCTENIMQKQISSITDADKLEKIIETSIKHLQEITGKKITISRNSNNTNTNSNNTQSSYNTNTNTNTYNININNHGQENIDYITKDYEGFCKYIKDFSEHETTMDNILLELYKLIHLNTEHPENHNIHITNLKTNLSFFVYINNQWQRSGRMPLLIEEVNKMYTILLENLTELVKETKPGNYRRRLEEILLQTENVYRNYQTKIERRLCKEYFQWTKDKQDLIEDTQKKTINLQRRIL